MNLRRALLAFLVSLCAGCAVTQWQRDMQTLSDRIDELQSAEMNAAIAAAHPGVPRKSQEKS